MQDCTKKVQANNAKTTVFSAVSAVFSAVKTADVLQHKKTKKNNKKKEKQKNQ